MTFLLLVLLAGDVPVRTVALSADATAKPLRVACPVGQITRIVFPQPFLPGGVKASPGATDTLGIALTASKPLGVVSVSPQSHPARGTLELRGQSVVLTIVLVSAPEGLASEVRLTLREAPPLQAPPPVEKTSTSHRARVQGVPTSPLAVETRPGIPAEVQPIPVRPELTSAALTPQDPRGAKAQVTLLWFDTPVAPMPSVPVPSMESPGAATLGEEGFRALTFDFEGLLVATPERISRREGLPGQPPVMLDDALKSDRWVWLRFTLPGGKTRVEDINWEHGPIRLYRTYSANSAVRLVVQLPRERVTKRTRVSLRLSPGGDYRFALAAPWLSSFLRDLF